MASTNCSLVDQEFLECLDWSILSIGQLIFNLKSQIKTTVIQSEQKTWSSWKEVEVGMKYPTNNRQKVWRKKWKQHETQRMTFTKFLFTTGLRFDQWQLPWPEADPKYQCQQHWATVCTHNVRFLQITHLKLEVNAFSLFWSIFQFWNGKHSYLDVGPTLLHCQDARDED